MRKFAHESLIEPPDRRIGVLWQRLTDARVAFTTADLHAALEHAERYRAWRRGRGPWVFFRAWEADARAWIPHVSDWLLDAARRVRAQLPGRSVVDVAARLEQWGRAVGRTMHTGAARAASLLASEGR